VNDNYQSADTTNATNLKIRHTHRELVPRVQVMLEYTVMFGKKKKALINDDHQQKMKP